MVWMWFAHGASLDAEEGRAKGCLEPVPSPEPAIGMMLGKVL